MSKQYLTSYTIDNAHPTDIFALAPTKSCLMSASGGCSINVYDSTLPEFPLIQTLENAHKLGCHHLVASRNGLRAASAGFAGEVKVWGASDGANGVQWVEVGGTKEESETWALALSDDGRYLAGTSYDGRVTVWDIDNKLDKIREMETKGSFGMCIDFDANGKFAASGHENGGIYILNNETGRLVHSLPSFMKPVRAVAFSPANKLLAAAGDSRTIAVYDVSSGEQVANLSGHTAWILSLAWSESGEYLLTGAFDGKAKVWSMETRSCVATHGETDSTLWSVKWLPRIGRAEMFAVGGAHRSISIYREASGS